MWLVNAAMRRPITILVVVMAVALASILAIKRMKMDIFPSLGSPTIYVAQPYGGMDPAHGERLYHVLLRVSLPLYHRH